MSVRGQIEAALALIAERAKDSGVAWIVGGSAGLMLRGLPLASEPRDLDLYIDDAEFDRLHLLLRPYAVAEPVLSETSMYRSQLCQYEIEGIEVELVGGFVVKAQESVYVTEVAELLLPLSLPVATRHGHIAHVAPLAHELWFNVLRERSDRCELIIEAFAREAAEHLGALEQLEARNALSPALKRQLHDRLAVKAGKAEVSR
ncbi:hypothetical protein [Paenibacillus sp. NEAU-GSW1]|uniref:hypothetical protein n=1 Tax=Paenibacillus sp. NEAU-GSW1 TaxID=2682486 RepID=UPI0012E3193B|nr:hypothetical protein [Paenibacillus sp. NEAU-GSW1]MUT65494.1 hypothetical protein [Paenibacillus sp. NEAU-GSW1]